MTLSTTTIDKIHSNNYGSSYCNLVISMGENVTSTGGGVRNYQDGDINLITAHVDGRYYGYVSVMTGKTDPRKSYDIWPEWTKDTVVHESIAVTKIHRIPNHLTDGRVHQKGLDLVARPEIMSYLLRLG